MMSSHSSVWPILVNSMRRRCYAEPPVCKINWKLLPICLVFENVNSRKSCLTNVLPFLFFLFGLYKWVITANRDDGQIWLFWMYQVCGKSTGLLSFNNFFINEILCNSFLGVQSSSVTSYNKNVIVSIHQIDPAEQKYFFLFLCLVFKERKQKPSMHKIYDMKLATKSLIGRFYAFQHSTSKVRLITF